MPQFGLVVFDLDGTLVDSSTDLADAINALLESLGRARLQDDAIVRMVGDGAPMLVRRALEAAGLDPATPGALERYLEMYDERLLDHTRPYPGMIAALEAIGAAGIPMAVLTNKPSAGTNRVLDGLGLTRYFAEIVGGDSSFPRKPDPAGLLHLAAACGATTPTALMVGDSRVDWETARRAGVRICLARYGFGYRFDAAELTGDEMVIDHPSELAAAVAAR